MVIDLVGYLYNMYISVYNLRFWANGNVVLMANTFMTMILSMCSLALASKAKRFLVARYWIRLTIFIVSLLYTVLFVTETIIVSISILGPLFFGVSSVNLAFV